MKVALTTWNGRISPVLDVARQVILADVEADRVVSRREEPLPGTDPAAQAARLAALAPQVLICGAISQPMSARMAGTGIRVIPFTAGAVDEVISAWLAGRLPGPAWTMPGCRGCGQGRRRRHGGGRRRGECGGPAACPGKVRNHQ